MPTKPTTPRKAPTTAVKLAYTMPKKAAALAPVMAGKSTQRAKPASAAAAAENPTKRSTSVKTATKTPTSAARTVTPPAAAPRPKLQKAASAPRDTKLSQLIAQLRTGSTIAQMTALTGWQPHSVRGVISGVLRKKMGFNVNSAVPADGGERLYRLEGTAAR